MGVGGIKDGVTSTTEPSQPESVSVVACALFHGEVSEITKDMYPTSSRRFTLKEVEEREGASVSAASMACPSTGWAVRL